LHAPSSFADGTGLAPGLAGLGALKLRHPLQAVIDFGVSWFADGPRPSLRPAGSLALLADRTGFYPAHEDFSVCAFDGLVILSIGRYGYGGNWESSAGGTLTHKNVS